jgi:exopolyphosphatase/guanosine-5'-triphosphate,3'-diphosphate pyrophosphatase
MATPVILDRTMQAVDDLSRAYDCDPAHNEKVTELALAIFDDLVPLHHYGVAERRLLEIAGRLHDTGWSQTVLHNHHKLSSELILRSEIPGLSAEDKVLCSLIARYHTKSVPNASKHPRFAALKPKQRDVVEWLAAVLRVADALDSSHTGIIKKLRMRVGEKSLTFSLETNGDCWDEIRRARIKQDLLMAKSGKSMIYRC